MLFRFALFRLPKSSTIFLSSSFSPSVFFCSTPYQFQSFLPDLLFSAVNVALVVFVVKCSHSRIHIHQMRLQIGDLCYPYGKKFLSLSRCCFCSNVCLFLILFRMKKLYHSNEQICLCLVRCQLFARVFIILLCCCLIWLPATVDAGLYAINSFISSNILDQNNPQDNI